MAGQFSKKNLLLLTPLNLGFLQYFFLVFLSKATQKLLCLLQFYPRFNRSVFSKIGLLILIYS